MTTLIGLVGAILVLAIAVGIHEFGHMLAAKRCGVGVIEYSIGLGPVIWHKRKGDTVYSVRIIPFGGYCAMYGEQSLEANDKGEAEIEQKPAKKHWFRKTPQELEYKTDWAPEQALTNQVWWKKFIVLAAGPFCNLLLGVIGCLLLTLLFQVPSEPTIVSLMDDHPAITSGIQVDDVIVGVEDRDVLTWKDYVLYLDTHPDITKDGYEMRVRRGDEIISIHATRREDDNYFGITIKQTEVPSSFGTIIKYTWNNVTYMFRSVFDSLGMLARGAASVKDMSGVVGVANMIVTGTEEAATEATEAGESAVTAVLSLLCTILAILSINLGIMNLLPIPALDGGRIVLSLVEGVSGRRVPTKVEYAINSIGMVLLMGFMVYIVFQDIMRIFG